MREIIIVGATLMNIEMTTVKGVNPDTAIGTMKADTRTTVASPLEGVDGVAIKASTGLTTAPRITDPTR